MTPGALTVNHKGINERIAYSQLINVEIENGLFWSTLVLRRKQGDPLYLKGCSKFDIRQFFEDFDCARDTYNAISKLLRQEAGLLAKTMEWVRQAQSGAFWVAHSALDSPGQ